MHKAALYHNEALESFIPRVSLGVGIKPETSVNNLISGWEFRNSSIDRAQQLFSIE